MHLPSSRAVAKSVKSSLLSSFLFFTAAAVAWAGTSTPATKPGSDDGEKRGSFIFSLLPKSIARNPRIDLNIITEMTAEGRKRPKVSPDHPAYYVAQPGGFVQLGQSPAGNERPPPVADLEGVMRRALASAGFLNEEQPAHPATIAVVYNWGSHTSPTEDDMTVLNELAATQAALDAGTSPPPPAMGTAAFAEDQLPRALSDLAVRKDVIERASIVGGGKFATELSQILAEEARYESAKPGAGIGGDYAPTSDRASPFGQYYNRDDRTAHLVEETFSSFYFVIATAYDYAALAKKQKVVLWRTKMTVNSLGVAMKETLPSLVVAAGQYLGRDMPVAETLSRRILRGGKVEIGEATVVKESVDGPGAPAADQTKQP